MVSFYITKESVPLQTLSNVKIILSYIVPNLERKPIRYEACGDKIPIWDSADMVHIYLAGEAYLTILSFLCKILADFLLSNIFEKSFVLNFDRILKTPRTSWLKHYWLPLSSEFMIFHQNIFQKKVSLSTAFRKYFFKLYYISKSTAIYKKYAISCNMTSKYINQVSFYCKYQKPFVAATMELSNKKKNNKKTFVFSETRSFFLDFLDFLILPEY